MCGPLDENFKLTGKDRYRDQGGRTDASRHTTLIVNEVLIEAAWRRSLDEPIGKTPHDASTDPSLRVRFMGQTCERVIETASPAESPQARNALQMGFKNV